MTIKKTLNTDFQNFGNANKGTLDYDAEFSQYDRVRSSDSHVILDFGNQITPVGYFDKFSAKLKSEIIYRQPVGSKVPIGELKPGGWDLTFSAGIIDDRMWAINDHYHKEKFDGNPTPRITIAQRIRYSVPASGLKNSDQKFALYMYWEAVIGGYSITDNGDGNPIDEETQGYARWRVTQAAK